VYRYLQCTHTEACVCIYMFINAQVSIHIRYFMCAFIYNVPCLSRETGHKIFILFSKISAQLESISNVVS